MNASPQLKQSDDLPSVHTEVVLPDRNIGFDLFCTENHLKEFTGGGYVYEPDVMAAIINLVRPGDICIDAGANLGYHSILMAKMAGKNGQVLSFEPDPTCFDKMKNNFALNGVNDICFPLPVALWNSNQFLKLFVGQCGYTSILEFTNMEQMEIEVEAITLDSVISPDVPIKLLKVDCEGSEEPILHGAENLLKRGVDAIIVEFNFSIFERIKSTDKSIRDYMGSFGYDLFFLFDNGMFPQCILPDTIIQRSEKRFHFNGLFCKRPLLIDNWKFLYKD